MERTTIGKKPTDQPVGYGRSGSAEGCKAGPARSSTSNRGLVEVGNQASTSFLATGRDRTKSLGGENAEADPFERRSSLNRTPPRASSLRDVRPSPLTVEDGCPTEESGKRKRRDSEEVRHLETVLLKMGRQIKELEILVKGNVNTKKEIKEAVETLKNLAVNTRPEKLRDFFDEVTTLKRQQDTKVPRQNPKTVSNASTQTESEVRESSTQTNAWSRAAKIRTIEDLSGVKTLGDFQQIAKLKLSEEVFTNSEVKVGNPLTTAQEVVKCTLLSPKTLICRCLSAALQRQVPGAKRSIHGF